MSTRDLHHIQKEIISSLARTAPQRFSQLQPSQIPNNTFSYHLKKLQQSGYVMLHADGYIATRKALKTLQYDGPSSKRTSAPVIITVLYITNDAGEVLLLQRNTQPFVGWYGLPSGLVHQGEHLEQAAMRELFEKTTIKATALKFSGVLDFQYLEKSSGDLFVHAAAFVYTYHLPSRGEQFTGLQSHYGTLLWSDLNGKRILPEVRSIAELTRKKEPLVESVDYDEPLMNL
jgi:ADP-ribose pyrophosphatase YjhB (NUDIX family)